MAEIKISYGEVNLEEKVFTLEELSKYDGKNGNPPYIAIKGVVYDISNVALLRNGGHHGVTAGNDVTSFFPHDLNIMKRVKVVGKLE
jgi:predicted heme/steroid binding protein